MTSAKTQGGYALLLFVVIVMGMGGVMFGGFLKDAKQEGNEQRYLHNQRVLKEAKQALLTYAYNYPVTVAGRGPGRLPCPDTDNSTTANSTANCTIIGRFPFNAAGMNFYDARDASGERLWYAVSSAFAYNISPADADVINTSTAGTLTIHSQSGDLMYDGSVVDPAVGGIAAVIIAPGAILARNGVAQDREITNGVDVRFDTTADTDPGLIDPVNYLDISGALDNADFTNASAADGFVLGPVFDANGSVVVNDQIILVTAAEVRAAAQKATLSAYRDVINDYLAIPGFGGVYPWLNAYDVIADPINLYNVVPGDTMGRLPTMNYFADDDSDVLVTDLRLDYTIDLDLSDLNVPLAGRNYTNSFSNFFAGQSLVISSALVSFKKQTFDLAADEWTDNLGTMQVRAGGATVVNVPVVSPVTIRQFYWDGCGGCPEPEDDVWEVCANNAMFPTDCAKKDSSPWGFEAFTDWANHADIRIRAIELDFAFDAELEIGFDYALLPATAPVYVPPGPAANARVTRDLDGSVTNIAVDVTSTISDTQDLVDVTVSFCDQDNFVGNNYNAFYLANADASTVLCTLDLASVPVVNQLDMTADYHPELPVWVRRNQWNDSILMAYANDHRPGGGGDCSVTGPCLSLDHTFSGLNPNVISLFVAAGAIPADSADLETIFEADNNLPDEQRNATPEDILFDARPKPGNDITLVMDEI